MGAATDRGRVRPHNEDSILADPAHGFALLADGVGGYNAGEVASHMAVTVIAEGLRERRAHAAAPDVTSLLKHEIDAANAAIHLAGTSHPAYAGMATTLVAAVFHDDRVTVAHVGDSRLYRLRAGFLQTLTRDHSVVQEQIERGALSAQAARLSPHAHLITRALGNEATVEAELHAYPVRPGDLHLLGSDGLFNTVQEGAIRQVLVSHSADLHAAAQKLVRMANENGGWDNVSVILVRTVPLKMATPAMLP
jgi:serine/threonine protein phosphatase PrpC